MASPRSEAARAARLGRLVGGVSRASRAGPGTPAVAGTRQRSRRCFRMERENPGRRFRVVPGPRSSRDSLAGSRTCATSLPSARTARPAGPGPDLRANRWSGAGRARPRAIRQPADGPSGWGAGPAQATMFVESGRRTYDQRACPPGSCRDVRPLSATSLAAEPCGSPRERAWVVRRAGRRPVIADETGDIPRQPGSSAGPTLDES